MKTMERRAFVLGPLQAALQTMVTPKPRGNFLLGKIADFPIGQNQILTDRDIVVESLPEGIRVRTSSTPTRWFAVSTDAYGQLTVDTEKPWPENQAFSILTNEPTKINPSLEE